MKLFFTFAAIVACMVSCGFSILAVDEEPEVFRFHPFAVGGRTEQITGLNFNDWMQVAGCGDSRNQNAPSTVIRFTLDVL